jgi:formate-dependent nitrite reductase cytochrome c552 subunit
MIDRRSKRRLLGAGAPFTGVLTLAAAISWLPLAVGAVVADEAARVEDSCVDCHSAPDFLVTNKKLYEYYRAWQLSVHQQEGVTCSDCHGGNPEASDKRGAHGDEVARSSKANGVSFRNIPTTCGQCHEEIYVSYRKSDHFKHLVAQKQELHGPNCVTCHESMSTAVLNVATVKAACARCHNEENDNHPKIPERAKSILNRFLSIQRFHRYLSVRLEPTEAREFFQEIDKQIHALSIQWHTFDLGEIEHETWKVVDLLRTERDKVRQRTQKSRQSE